jgi:hypothetical protein
MATVQVHKDQSSHNKAFLDSITNNNFRDWKLTVAFYAALHAIDSGLTSKDLRWREKRTDESLYSLRDKILAMWNRDMYRHYSFLLIRSKEARYLENIGNHLAKDYFTDDQISSYIRDHLVPILNFFHIS